LTLPLETVRRALPPLGHPDDARLFAAEAERVFPSVSTHTVTGPFLPSGWHTDLGGWKGLLKGAAIRAVTRNRDFVPRDRRVALIATDRLSNGYFHWVTETLPRLWWLRDQLSEFELVLPAFASRLPYMTESLALFPELAFRVLDPQTRWRLEGALLVPALAPSGNFRPRFIAELGAAWRARTGASTPFRKIYVSRSQATRRRIVNESAVRMNLEAQGFETVHLEGMAFADQVRLLAETSHLVSNHGAGLTNLLFMVPGTTVTEIRLRGDVHNNCYFSLARAVGLDYQYRLADSARPSRDAHTADLMVDPKALP